MRVTDTCFYTIARDRSKTFFLIYIVSGWREKQTAVEIA